MNNPSNRGATHPEQRAGGMAETAKEAAQNVGQAAGQAWDATKQTAQKAWDATKEGAQKTWDTTKEMASRTADAVETGYEGFTDLVRRDPVASVCIAMGAGFLLASLLNLGNRA
jgi:ElaB/YqjD/DUF883 family membrane-anchored ribosome-binding protein